MKAKAFKNILSATALAVTAGISINATAGQVDETLVEAAAVDSKTVTFSRAELNTAEGRAAIEREIRNAADAVCGSRDLRVAGLRVMSENKKCYDEAVNEAMAQLGAGQVAAID